jgi:His-Xaa-Ser system protein HxsD
MQHKNGISNGEITVYATTSLYSKDSILKCLYWYGDKFHINISMESEEEYRISLKPIPSSGLKEEELETYQYKLERDLIDFNLRDIVTKETKNIRDLLVAKAFSNGELDELPPGEITDPVGFDVKNVS